MFGIQPQLRIRAAAAAAGEGKQTDSDSKDNLPLEHLAWKYNKVPAPDPALSSTDGGLDDDEVLSYQA